MKNFTQKLTDMFNLRSSKVAHITLGILSWLGTTQAIGLGLTMAGLPGGGYLIGSLAGSLLGFHNYYAMQRRTTLDTPAKTLGRNVGVTASTAFGAAAAGLIFSAGAIATPAVVVLAAAFGTAQYLALPKSSGKLWNKPSSFKLR